MYCSSCGVVITNGLSYCNHCGARLIGAKGDNVIKSSEGRPEPVVAAMVALFVFGLAAITGLMGMMKVVLGLNVGQILGFTVLSFLIMVLLEGVFIRLLFRRSRGAKQAADTVLPTAHATKELNAAQGQALSEPVPSVTEHTTRSFEGAYRERTSE